MRRRSGKKGGIRHAGKNRETIKQESVDSQKNHHKCSFVGYNNKSAFSNALMKKLFDADGQNTEFSQTDRHFYGNFVTDFLVHQATANRAD